MTTTTTITISRATVEQALEALEQSETFVPYEGFGMARREAERKHQAAITALRAALEQRAEPTGKESLQVESVVAENATTQQQIEQTPPSDYRRGYWDGFNIGKREGRIEAEDKLAQQAEPEAYGYASRLAVAIWEKHYKDTAPQWKPLDDLMGVLTQIDNMTSGLTRMAQQQANPPGCEHCNHPLYAATRCRVCGRVTEQAEPVKPVAWVDERAISWLASRRNKASAHITTGLSAAKTIERTVPLYAVPPQRKPLTEEEATALVQSVVSNSDRPIGMVAYGLLVVGAVERAHGIGDNA